MKYLLPSLLTFGLCACSEPSSPPAAQTPSSEVPSTSPTPESSKPSDIPGREELMMDVCVSPFKPAFCMDGSDRSVRELVINPYRSSNDTMGQREMRKRLAKPCTISFEGVTVKEAFAALAREANVNIVQMPMPTDREEPTVTLKLKEVPLYEALGYVSEVCGIYFRIDAHAVVIRWDNWNE